MKYFTGSIIWLTFVVCTVEVLTAKVIKVRIKITIVKLVKVICSLQHREFFYSNVTLVVNEKYINASKNQPSCAVESPESPCKM